MARHKTALALTSAGSMRASTHVRPHIRGMRPAVVRRWCSLATAAGALLVVALWARGSGLSDLAHPPGRAVASLGRLTGLAAAALLVIQLAAMARLPVLERAYGRVELTRRHRLAGLSFFVLLVAHVVLATLGGALLEHRNVAAEAWLFTAHYAGMVLALLALLAFCCVVVTSLRTARRRLRYESWHLLHLYAYVGTILSIPHELWTGRDLGETGVRFIWLSSYAVVGLALLTYRVALPVVRSLRSQITVTSVTAEADDVVTVHMAGRGIGRLGVSAGQFFVWRFLDGPGWSRGNPYSLSAAPRRNRIQITAREAGDGRRRLSALQPGTRVLIEGPYGRLTSRHRVGNRVVMLACGIGITPLKALLEDLDLPLGQATLIYRARSEADVLFGDDLRRLSLERGVELHLLLGRRRVGRMSWLPQDAPDASDVAALRRLVPDVRHRDVFVCGPDGWMAAACNAAVAAGVPEAQLHRERFAW